MIIIVASGIKTDRFRGNSGCTFIKQANLKFKVHSLVTLIIFMERFSIYIENYPFLMNLIFLTKVMVRNTCTFSVGYGAVSFSEMPRSMFFKLAWLHGNGGMICPAATATYHYLIHKV